MWWWGDDIALPSAPPACLGWETLMSQKVLWEARPAGRGREALPHHAADRHLRTCLPKPASCWFGAKCAGFPPGSARKRPGLDSNTLICFLNKAPSSIQGAREMPAFPRCLSLSTSLSLSENTSPSVCKVSASCLTSLIYKANRTFLLTHIMLSLLMQKTVSGGRAGAQRDLPEQTLQKLSPSNPPGQYFTQWSKNNIFLWAFPAAFVASRQKLFSYSAPRPEIWMKQRLFV